MISIVIPLYNKENSIKRTLDSVLNQTSRNYEVVIVDDGSTDGSAEIVKGYSCDNISYYYKANGGVSSARNYGIQKAKGEWIMILDADDCLIDSALDDFYSMIEEHQADMYMAGFYIELPERKIFVNKISKPTYLKDNFRDSYFLVYDTRAGAFVVKKEIALRYSFDENLSLNEDMKTVHEYLRNCRTFYSPKSVMIYKSDFSTLSKVYNKPERDFRIHADLKNKPFWEQMLLAENLARGIRDYKSLRFDIIRKYKKYMPCVFLSIIFHAFRIKQLGRLLILKLSYNI